MKRPLVLALLAILWIGLAWAQGNADKPYVVMAPVGRVQLNPGGSANVELAFRVGSEFHINSHKPKQDYLIPTALQFTSIQPLAIADVKYPSGEDMSFAFAPNEKLSVYSGDFAINAVVRTPATTAPGSYPVKGELHFQACDHRACYPPRSIPVQFEVNVAKK